MADLEELPPETRAWLDANAPDRAARQWRQRARQGVWGGRALRLDPSADEKLWLERMAARGWTAPTWPKEYGGGGLSAEEAKVLAEEMARLQAAAAADRLRPLDDRPALLALRQRGAEARAPAADRARRDPLVPGLLRAGRGLRPRVACRRAPCRDGDDFIVNGQKVWTSYADKADWMFVLVRTDSDAPRSRTASRSC